MRARLVLLLAALLLPLAYLLSPPSAPPLYDGIGMPDEPYRHLGVPGTAPAGSVRRQVPVVGGVSPPLDVATGEQGPQAALAVPRGALVLPEGATVLSVTVEPVPLPAPVEDGRALSNAYRLRVTDAQGRGAELGQSAGVLLRIPAKTGGPVAVELFRDGRWSTLPTSRAGEDVYSAALPALGEVAAVLVQDPSRSRAYAASGERDLRPRLLLAGVGLLLLAVVLVLRARRSRARGPGRRPDEA